MSTKPKALFIIPPAGELVEKKSKKYHRRFPPLSALIAAEILRRKGWGVEIHDLNANPLLGIQDTLEKARDTDFVILETNPYADWQCPSFDISPILKLARYLPGQKLAIVGNHGTCFPSGIITATGARCVVREEPEMIISEIADAIMNSREFHDICGISYLNVDGAIRHNPSRLPDSLDMLPAPAYDLIDLKDYYYELLGDQFALAESSRGCPHKCNFCNLSMFQGTYRRKSAGKFLSEVDLLIENHRCRSLYVFDLEFAANRKLVETFCNHLIQKDYVKRYNFQWTCQTRVDSVDELLLKRMKQSGCRLIHFGVEAGNAQVLAATKKGVTLEIIWKGFNLAREAGINTAAFFIIGHPGETEKEYGETLQLALDLEPTYASFHTLSLYPGSILFAEKHGKGPYWEKTLNDYPLAYNRDREDAVAGFVRRAYWRFYIRPQYLMGLFKNIQLKSLFCQLRLFQYFTRR